MTHPFHCYVELVSMTELAKRSFGSNHLLVVALNFREEHRIGIHPLVAVRLIRLHENALQVVVLATTICSLNEELHIFNCLDYELHFFVRLQPFSTTFIKLAKFLFSISSTLAFTSGFLSPLRTCSSIDAV